MAADVAAGGERLGRGRPGHRGPRRDPRRTADRRARLVIPGLRDGNGHRRADRDLADHLRPAAVAPPGTDGAGADRRTRRRAADRPRRRHRGRRGDPHRAAPGAGGRARPLPAAAIPPGRDRHDRHRQDDLAAEAVGGIRRGGMAALRRRIWPQAAARHPGLQGRRRLTPGGRPGPPGAAVGGRPVDRDLAGRGKPVAVAAAARPADDHPARPHRAGHRRAPPTTPT